MRAVGIRHRGIDRLIERLFESFVAVQIAQWLRFSGCRLLRGRSLLGLKDFGVDKAIACLDERTWSFFFTKPINRNALLPNPGSEASEIAVARNKAETSQPVRMQQIHCI